MVCPHYEGGKKCGFKDSSYVLTQYHIASFCDFPGNEYTDCSVYKEAKELVALRRNTSSDSKLEARAQSLPKGTTIDSPATIRWLSDDDVEKMYPSTGFLRRDQLPADIPDSEISSMYHEGPGGTFIPK